MNAFEQYREKRARERELNSLTKFAGSLDALKDLALRLNNEVEALKHSQTVLSRESIDLFEEVRRFEIDLIKRALIRSGGVQKRAAQMLNLRPQTLSEKMKRFNLG